MWRTLEEPDPLSPALKALLTLGPIPLWYHKLQPLNFLSASALEVECRVDFPGCLPWAVNPGKPAIMSFQQFFFSIGAFGTNVQHIFV